MKAHPVPVWNFSIHVLIKHEAAAIMAKASGDPAVSARVTTARMPSPACTPLMQGEKALTLWSPQ